MPRDKSRYRDKRSSSYSSESSYDRKKSKSKHKRRSRSREKSESSRNSRRKRSSSRSKYKRRSYSRSVSRDRYESKSRRRSSSRSKSKRSKNSRDRSRSHSRSRSRSKHSKSSKRHRRRSYSSSRSDSFDIEKSYRSKCFINVDDTETQVEKAIKAAEAAGVTLTKVPTYEYKDVEIREDMPTIHDRNVLNDINSDSFVQKSFVSSKNKKQSTNIVIDLNAETVKIPESETKPQNDDSIINFAVANLRSVQATTISFSNIPSEVELKEMWIKKLYQFRKKMLRGEIQ